jgi:hypothetical protein
MKRIALRMRTIAVALGVTVSGLALAGDKSSPDLDGLPDLIVRRDMLEAQWVVRVERLSPTACSVIEGGVQPGERKLVRFTVGTANVGDADIFVGNPQDHVDANDGLFEFASCHAHYHFRNYAKYELIEPSTGRVWRAAKRGFCMLDTDPNPASLGGAAGPHFYRSCGTTSSPGNQGISVGWTDTYRFFLGGQFFVLDGGDGQDPVPPGRYIIRITANPPFTPEPGEACPNLDPAGFCHQLPESNYANNVQEVSIDIPAHLGRSGVGPLAGTPPREEPADCGN